MLQTKRLRVGSKTANSANRNGADHEYEAPSRVSGTALIRGAFPNTGAGDQAIPGSRTPGASITPRALETRAESWPRPSHNSEFGDVPGQGCVSGSPQLPWRGPADGHTSLRLVVDRRIHGGRARVAASAGAASCSTGLPCDEKPLDVESRQRVQRGQEPLLVPGSYLETPRKTVSRQRVADQRGIAAVGKSQFLCFGRGEPAEVVVLRRRDVDGVASPLFD